MTQKMTTSEKQTTRKKGSVATVGSVITTVFIALALWYFGGGNAETPKSDQANEQPFTENQSAPGGLLTREAENEQAFPVPTNEESEAATEPASQIAKARAADQKNAPAADEEGIAPAVVLESGAAEAEPTAPAMTPTVTATAAHQPTARPPDPLPSAPPDMRTIRMEQLPPEAVDTIQLIWQNGPFPFEKDDTTFGNREGLLPDKEYDYYREFTVVTPGLSHRGPRRIVEGAEGELYYTEDHYGSFYWVITE